MGSRHLVVIAALLALAAAPANGGELAEKVSPEVILAELSSRLSLTPEQQAHIEPLLRERNDRILALIKGLDAGASRRTQLKTLRQARSIQEEFVSGVTPVLTPEQDAEWEKLREETKDRLEEAWKGRKK